MEMTDLYCLYRRVTLKIMSRSTKSNQLFLPFQQCIYASLVKIPLKIMSMSPKSNQLFPISQQCIYLSLVKIWFRRYHKETIFWTFQSAGVTLKIRSRSPKSNQLFPSSQQCIYEFGQNSSTSSDNPRKPSFGHFKVLL